MSIIKGDTVKAHYTGTLGDGTVFDSSRDRAPLEFVMGQGSLIPGFEEALLGKKVGDSVTVSIPPAQAYGESDPELIFTVARGQVPPSIVPEKGMQLQLTSDDGVLDVTVVDVGADEIILDANHPLAGKVLTFDIEIVG